MSFYQLTITCHRMPNAWRLYHPHHLNRFVTIYCLIVLFPLTPKIYKFCILQLYWMLAKLHYEQESITSIYYALIYKHIIYSSDQMVKTQLSKYEHYGYALGILILSVCVCTDWVYICMHMHYVHILESAYARLYSLSTIEEFSPYVFIQLTQSCAHTFENAYDMYII